MDFWPRLIAWAADRRMRLGPAAQQLVIETFGELGWPTFDPPACPIGLKHAARRALNTVLASVVLPAGETGATSDPELSPTYVGPEGGGLSIGQDAAALHDRGLVGLATVVAHWSKAVESVEFHPPPPEKLALALKPGQIVEAERDLRVASFLRDRRLTIVGGIPAEEVVTSLCGRFGLAPAQIRWIGAEKSRRMNLDSLEGLRAEVDVVYCVTGHIGHAGSAAARTRCRKRGVEIHSVENASQIGDHLCDRHAAEAHRE